MSLLRDRGVGMPDWPLPFRHAHPRQDEFARAFLPAIETLQGDAVAWEALFTDTQRLATFKAVYGNRKGPKRRVEPPSFDFGAAEVTQPPGSPGADVHTEVP